MSHFYHSYKDIVWTWVITGAGVLTHKQLNDTLTTVSLLLAISYTIYRFSQKGKE